MPRSIGNSSHYCIVCKKDYFCDFCAQGAFWACATVNEDEDGCMCLTCLEKFAEDLNDYGDCLDET